jgi:acid phosphatase
MRVLVSAVFVAGLAVQASAETSDNARHRDKDELRKIETIVVIYGENRSFDNLYGYFPGAHGLWHVRHSSALQTDRDGKVLKELPPVWGGLTATGVTPQITEAQTAHLPNAVFRIDDPKGFNLPLSVATRDLVHRFYQNQMQIHNGRNDRFAAWTDAGGLVMGVYDGSTLPLWKVAKEFTLADHFFMGAFGGSFLNHHFLICSCAPVYPKADQSPAKSRIAVVDPDGVTLTVAADSPASALSGPPKFVNDGAITPDFYAVNTMQPPYQPSAIAPASGGDPRYADPSNSSTLPPQTQTTIGELLTAKGITWPGMPGPGRWPSMEKTILAFRIFNITTNPSIISAPMHPERRHAIRICSTAV